MTCACTAPSPTLMTLFVDLDALPEAQIPSLQQEVNQTLSETLPKVEGWTTDKWVFGFYELLQAFDEVQILSERVGDTHIAHKTLCQTIRGEIGFPEVMISKLCGAVAEAYRVAGERRGVSLPFLGAHFEVL